METARLVALIYKVALRALIPPETITEIENVCNLHNFSNKLKHEIRRIKMSFYYYRRNASSVSPRICGPRNFVD